MHSSIEWSANIILVSNNLYRTFGYVSDNDRADAIHGAILRLLNLQRSSGLTMQDVEIQRWLHCVATRMLLDSHRSSMRTKRFSDFGLPDTSGEDLLSIVNESKVAPPFTDLGLDINAALLHLTPSLRCTFELHTQGFSAEEIAGMLCVGREAVHKRVQRARRELQVFLKDYL